MKITQYYNYFSIITNCYMMGFTDCDIKAGKQIPGRVLAYASDGSE